MVMSRRPDGRLVAPSRRSKPPRQFLPLGTTPEKPSAARDGYWRQVGAG